MTYIPQKGFKDNEDNLLSEQKERIQITAEILSQGEIVSKFLLQSSRDDEDPEDSITQ